MNEIDAMLAEARHAEYNADLARNAARQVELAHKQAAAKKDDARSTTASAQWIRLLRERIEEGHDPIDAFSRVLIGAWTDELAGLGMPRGGVLNETDNIYAATILSVDRTAYQLIMGTQSRWALTPELRGHFLEVMTSKGPVIAGKTRRLRIGSTLAEKAWQLILNAAYKEMDRAAVPGAVDWEAYRAGRLRPDGLTNPPVWTDRDVVRSIGHDELALIPPSTWLLDDLVGHDQVAFLAGQFGSYKSFVLLGWAVAIATGTPWCDHAATEPAAVLYVAAEGLGGQGGRLDAYCHAHSLTPPAGLRWFNRRLNLGQPDSVDELISEARRVNAKLVIIDTLHKSAVGVDTIGDGGAGVVMEALDRIRSEAGTAVLVAHHTGYAGDHLRGSSALEDDADVVWLIDKRGGQGGADPRRILTQRKNRDGQLATERELVFTAHRQSGYVHFADGPEWTPDEVNAALDKLDLPDSVSERVAAAKLTAESLDIPRRRINAALRERKLR